MATLSSINPFTQQVNATFETISNDDVDQIIETAHQAFLSRSKISFSDRAQYCLQLADLIDADLESLAELETIEMGRLLGEATNGLKSTANLIRWYANNAETILSSIEFDQFGIKGKTIYEPLGVIYGIAPWNFPFNQLLRAAVANIMAGNTTVYKHASNVPLCADAIQKLFEKAGFPEGVYTNLFISASQSEHILANKHIAGVNLTGSEGAGSAVGSLAGKYLKPSVLELGGNDAFVLLDHADTYAMAASAMSCRISNGGQRCNASKRFIILEKHYDQFVESLKVHMEGLVLGDPMSPETTLPPLARPDLVEEIDNQVNTSIKQGARLVTGGKKVGGNFYAPTVLADVTPDMLSFQEEIFGPVASVIKSSSIEESIALANNSDFGLSAVVFGDDLEACNDVAEQLEGGMIFINRAAGSQASLPFGGVKKSGYGKENGPEGLKAFTNKKVIVYSIQ